ncbi:LOB domain-containing protein 1-like [Magnolia sinica]|uniref:LOB domain-containing protein 1-like n=1 Tax=Magnolia sinica TaxID=86752 RepID=UPI0026597AED|nr:LOB domain-containing protein 1-like [Magnolia sinica]
MEASDTTTSVTTTSLPFFISPSTSPTSSPPTIVVSPCAACKILRRRCIDKCVLAPYFPPTEPLKFTTAHRVFGASNIIKFLQDLPEPQRADAVSSMVYEANARIRDPVYGCAGAICHLQKQVNELQTQLAQAQAEVLNMQTQQANLMAIICMEMAHSQQPQLDNGYLATNPYMANTDSVSFLDNSDSDSNNNINNPDSLWEPLWT